MSVISLAGFSSSEGGRIITLPRSMFLHWGSTITPRPPAAPVTIHFVCVYHTPKPYFPLESVCMQYGIPYSTARTHTQAAGFFTLYSSVGQIHEYIDEYVDCSPVVEQNILILSWDTRRQIMKWFILADSMASSSEWLQLLQNTVLFFSTSNTFLMTENQAHCILQMYLRWSRELVSHSWCHMCLFGKDTCILSRRELACHCWGKEHTCRYQTHPSTAGGPSSGVSSLWQHMGSPEPDQWWVAPGQTHTDRNATTAFCSQICF